MAPTACRQSSKRNKKDQLRSIAKEIGMQTQTISPQPESTTAPTNSEYTFSNGYPSGDTAQRAYDEADLNRATEAYKFFYPSVSILATWKGNEAAGVVSNRSFLILQGSPHQLVFTPNSDTPYAGANIDLSSGPMVVELPPGPFMCVANDLNQR